MSAHELGTEPRGADDRSALAQHTRAALERAQALAREGRWEQAAPLFREVIAEATDEVDALRGLGLAALHGDRPEEAVAWFTRARYSAPYSVPILTELGLAQKRCGLLDDAIASYRRALSLDERDTALLVNLGRAEREAGRLRGAILAFRKALEIEPCSPDVWSMLSNSLREARRPREALAAAREALTQDPWLGEAHLNEGAALHALGKLPDAVASYFVAGLEPRLRAAALANLQVALRSLGSERASASPAVRLVLQALARPRDTAPLVQLGRRSSRRRPLLALRCYEHALGIQPEAAAELEAAQLLWQLGRVEAALERLLRAIASDRGDVQSYRLLAEWLAVPNKISLHSPSWQRLLAECPDDALALRNLGVALRRRGFPLQAAALHRRALALAPDRPATLVNLGAALSSQGSVGDAIAAYRRALELDPGHWDAASNLLFSLHLDPEQSPEAIFGEHLRYAERVRERVPRATLRRAAPLEGRRLRVGYVSPDLCSHPVAHFFEPVLRAHDRSRLEIFCYSDARHPDAVTERLAGLAEHFVPCAGWGDAELGERIAADQIDILVDLAGHTANNRLPLFARRPSPLAVSWLGYFDTTGLDAVDARIADAASLPPEAERYFVERVLRLPRSANCFLPPPGPEPSAPPCLARGRVTFGCFNNPAKIGRRVVSAFARVLRAVPESQLLLKYLAFNEAGMQARYRAWFVEQGISPERLRFEGPSSLERFLDSFREIDVALDPFPYSGETTALHTLWMGVPLVALEGPTLVQRLASRVLRIAGLDDWVARSEDDYVRIASTLAADPAALARTRRELRARLAASPLLDHAGVTRELESAYQELWRERVLADAARPT